MGPQGERVTYRHDGLGRVVERRLERDGFRPLVWSYGWDGRDRLVSCETPTGEVWAYGYDPFGRRLWKRRTDAAGGTAGTAYGWDGDLLSAEAPLRADGSAEWEAATVWHYEPGTFRPIAREGSDGSLLYVVTDHLGTPRELLDESGRAVWSAEYRLWGAVRRVWVAANDDGPGGTGRAVGGFTRLRATWRWWRTRRWWMRCCCARCGSRGSGRMVRRGSFIIGSGIMIRSQPNTYPPTPSV